jgi:DNA-binding beta-propeller fold protein YncE
MRDRRIRTIDPKTGAKGILVHLPNSPEGLAVSPTTDFVYATNSRASCIYEINPETKAYKILAVGAGLTSPRGLAVSKAGLLYVADLDTNCIHTIDVGSGIAKILAGSVCGYADAAGGDRWVNDGVAAKFNSPTGVAIAPSGTLYVTDALNMCIRKIDPTTGAVSTVSGLPLSSPCGIAVSSEGILYIADTGNNRILRFDPLTGEKKILADSGSPGFLESPGGVAVGPSPSDEIYVADTDNYRVCVIAPSTKEPTAASRLNRRTTRHRKANRKTHRSRKTRRSQ